MHQSRQTPPAGQPGRCDWHAGPSGTARRILIGRPSGAPLAPLYACQPCREQRALVHPAS